MKKLVLIFTLLAAFSNAQCDFYFPSDTTVCQNSFVNLYAFGAVNYTWCANNNCVTDVVVIGDTSFFSVPVPFSTSVYVEGNMDQCSISKTFNLTVQTCENSCDFILPNDTTICNGQSVNLCAYGATNYTFTANGQSQYFIGVFNANPVCINVNPSYSTVYTLFASDGTCFHAKYIYVTVDACTGIQEYSPSEIKPRYWDLYGNACDLHPGEVLIEQRGNVRRKVLMAE